MERLSVRINLGFVNPRDMLAVKKTLLLLPELKKMLAVCQAGLLQQLSDRNPDLSNLVSELDSAIRDDATFSV